MTDLNELLERVKAATGPDRQLDYVLFCHFAPMEVASAWHPLNGHKYTSSIDAALALCGRALPGYWYVMAKGRMTDSEPLYACELLEGAETQLAINEGHTQPLAILAALILALISKAQEHDQQ